MCEYCKTSSKKDKLLAKSEDGKIELKIGVAEPRVVNAVEKASKKIAMTIRKNGEELDRYMPKFCPECGRNLSKTKKES